jgi:hypothetical protein
MPHRLSPIKVAFVALIALASPVSAASGPSPAERTSATADHLAGIFQACGRIVEFTAPMIGTDGSLTVAGMVDGDDHAFTIDEAALVSPLVAPLAAGGEWTCLHLTGDGMGIITDVAVADDTSCGPLEDVGGTFVLQPGSTDEFTTTVLDGDAAVILAADPDLVALLEGIAMVEGPLTSEACLEFQLAGDGTLSAILLDYVDFGLPASIACGTVDGTPIPYRDPASQLYPEFGTVSVDGFEMDASFLLAPYLSVLAFHLDALMEVCLLVEIDDNVIVDASVINLGPAEVCGELEVIGGLVFVATVVVSQGLTGVNFADPAASSIDLACWSARAQTGGAATGELFICGDFDAATDTTFTVSDITFHLVTSVDASDLPPVGGPQTVVLIGPDPFTPFGPGNPARVTTADLSGCAEAPPLPNTSTHAPAATSPVAPLAVLALLWLVGLVGVAAEKSRRG